MLYVVGCSTGPRLAELVGRQVKHVCDAMWRVVVAQLALASLWEPSHWIPLYGVRRTEYSYAFNYTRQLPGTLWLQVFSGRYDYVVSITPTNICFKVAIGLYLRLYPICLIRTCWLLNYVVGIILVIDIK